MCSRWRRFAASRSGRSPDLRALLEAQHEQAKALKAQRIICPWVFHRDGERIKYFRGAWKSACKAGGCPGRIPYDFRRTAVRNLVRAGVAEKVAMQLTGHKTRSVFDRYDIVSGDDLRHAVSKLSTFTGILSGILAEKSTNPNDNQAVKESA